MTAVCTLASVIEAAQRETGLEIADVGSAGELQAHVLRYRQRLVARCANRWKDVDKEDTLTIPAIPGIGWGEVWGDDWGGTLGDGFVALPAMEAIWEVRAHRLSDDTWPIVHVATVSDLPGVGRPALTLRKDIAVLHDYVNDWYLQYDAIVLQGVPVAAVIGLGQNDALELNALVAPAFCRCLELEAAKLMVLQDNDQVAAGGFAVDLVEAEADLLKQVESHNVTLASRQCQRP